MFLKENVLEASVDEAVVQQFLMTKRGGPSMLPVAFLWSAPFDKGWNKEAKALLVQGLSQLLQQLEEITYDKHKMNTQALNRCLRTRLNKMKSTRKGKTLTQNEQLRKAHVDRVYGRRAKVRAAFLD